MKTWINIWSLSFLSLLIGVQLVSGASSTGSVGFEFLRTETGARPTALGGAFTAIPADLDGLAYNPAAIGTLNQRTGSVTYLKHLLDFHAGNMSAALPQAWGTVALSINYINFGEFKRTTTEDPDGTSGETFGANSFVVAASVARPFGKILTAGMSTKYIRSGIDNYASDAFAVDLGVIAQLPLPREDHVNFGFSVGNLGTVRQAFIETKDALPLVFRVGFSKKLAHLPLLVSLQGHKYTDDDFRFAVGGELILSPQMFLRLGYNSLGTDQKIGTSADRLAGLNFGLGLNWRSYKIDYTFSSAGDVGSLNRLGISGTF
jgi:hypothetical protein